MDMDIQNTESIDTPNETRMFTQEELNKIVGREKSRAAQAALSAAEAQHAEQIEALRAQQMQRNAEVPRDVDINAISQQVQQHLAEEMEKQRMDAMMRDVSNRYMTSLDAGRQAYDDFDDVVGNFEPENMPQLTYLMSGMENASDILYEISKNPQKIATLDYLAQRNPRLAQAEMLRISKSINDNRQALADAQQMQIRQPLERLTPSQNSANNGRVEIKDLRQQPWLR